MTKEEIDRMRKAVEKFGQIEKAAQELVNMEIDFLTPVSAFARSIQTVASEASIVLKVASDYAEKNGYANA